MDKYFGIYCPYHNVWITDTKGRFIYYPAAAIAEAHLSEYCNPSNHVGRNHLWKVEEFGKQQQIKIGDLPPGSAICPMLDYE
jgi:hypothetical protein